MSLPLESFSQHLREQRDKDIREAKVLLDVGFDILYLAVKDAAEAGNVTCKLAIANLTQLYGNIRSSSIDSDQR